MFFHCPLAILLFATSALALPQSEAELKEYMKTHCSGHGRPAAFLNTDTANTFTQAVDKSWGNSSYIVLFEEDAKSEHHFLVWNADKLGQPKDKAVANCTITRPKEDDDYRIACPHYNIEASEILTVKKAGMKCVPASF